MMVLVIKLFLMVMGVVAVGILVVGFTMPLLVRFFQWAIDWWGDRFEEKEAKKRE